MRLNRIRETVILGAGLALILAACNEAGGGTPTPVVISGSPPAIETTIEPTEILVVVVTPTPGAEATESAEAETTQEADSTPTEEAATESGQAQAEAEAAAETGQTQAETTAEATEEAGTAEATQETDQPSETETPRAEGTAEATGEATEETGMTKADAPEAEATEEAGTAEATEQTDQPSETETPLAEGTAEATEAAGTLEAEATQETGTAEAEATEETDKPSETETPQAEGTAAAAGTAEAEAPPSQLSDEQLAEMGEGLFALNCAACHQANGQGIEGVYPPLAGNEFVLTDDPSPAIQVVLTGRAGMPHFQDYLSTEEIAAILSYVRNAWGNNASPVNVEQIQQVQEDLYSEVEAVER
ncbi:MAG: cytochrome c [Anaerolineae bacterium]|nr:cytochrome c [Anaerolineae bacterium]